MTVSDQQPSDPRVHTAAVAEKLHAATRRSPSFPSGRPRPPRPGKTMVLDLESTVANDPY
jgi:hypothetical protein